VNQLSRTLSPFSVDPASSGADLASAVDPVNGGADLESAMQIRQVERQMGSAVLWMGSPSLFTGFLFCFLFN
jgi:hypothetical protein